MTAIKPTLIFDWDGTLVDSLPVKTTNVCHVFAKHFSYSADCKAVYYANNGRSRRQIFDTIAHTVFGSTLSRDQYEQMSAHFTQLNRTSIADYRLFPGVHDLLATLSPSYTLRLASSAAVDEVTGTSESLAVNHFFASITAPDKETAFIHWAPTTKAFAGDTDHDQYLAQKYAVPFYDVRQSPITDMSRIVSRSPEHTNQGSCR